jgi:SAM-dependent methyltransferase
LIARTETTCRSCGSTDLEVIIEFGSTPLADRLLRADQLDEPELVADLTLVFCGACALVQIRETVDPEILFFAEYPYFSSVSPSLMAHFAASAEQIMQRWPLDGDSLVVEAASNDGYMLRNFAAAGIPVLGIDPAQAPANAANEAGIPTTIDFFGHALAKELTAVGRHADVFLGNNVLAHVPDLNGFVAGIAELLTERGVAVIEAPYLVDLVDHCEFDTIYHQHLCYFSVTALDALFARHGLHLNDVEQVAIHGGSLRLFVQRFDDRTDRVRRLLDLEHERNFDRIDAYRDFAARVAQLRSDLMAIIEPLRAGGATIAGYGAAAKATTLLAYCGIDKQHLEYVCDLNVYKQGKFMGGNKLAIHPPSMLAENRPDYVMILAWNFATEIMAQNEEFARAGGRFIVPVPRPHVVEQPT